MRLIVLFVLAASVHAAAPVQLGFDPLKQLVLDTRVIEHSENARLVLGSPVKEARNPVFQADQPWENATNNLYPNVLWDEQEQIFKLWYKDVLADAGVIAQMDHPSTVHDVGWYLLYATSKDGLAWNKPALGLHKFNGSAATNIVARDTPNVGVFKDLHDPDAARRYKMVYDVGLGKPRVRFSADGIHWSDPIEVTGFPAQYGDTHNNAFWDSRIGRYVWFTKLYLGERLVARLESDDFLTWKPNGLVLRSTLEEGRGSQTYCLPVFPYGNIYLGYVMIYHLSNGRTVDCELAWSHDGLRWQRVSSGTPFIPRGEKGSYDSECIYAQAGPATMQDGKLMIFYGGSDFPHTGWKRHCLPCLARLRVDGFAGYEAMESSKPAVLTSAPLKLVKEALTLSADAAHGSVLIELLDDRGKVLTKSKAITGDLSDEAVALDLKAFAGTTVRLRFTLDRARLYAFGGVSLVKEEMPASVLAPLPRVAARAEPIRVSFEQDAANWKGVERIEHHASGGFKGGYVTISREKNLRPIAASSPDGKASALVGDWPTLLGGETATISCQIRAGNAGGKVILELFARDTSQWSYQNLPAFTTEWQTITAPLRYDWTDDQAEAAGWTRNPMSFSWRETIRNVGKVVLVPGANGAQQSFDLDEVEVRGK